MWPSSLSSSCVEHLLVLEPLLLVDRVDAGAHRVARQLEARVDHAVDGGIHGVRLHLHEVGERVVEIEDDRSDHASLGPLLGRHADAAPQADLAVVDANVESAVGLLHTHAL